MKKKTAILSDTNSGISAHQAAEYGVYLLPMPVIIDGAVYFEDVSITPEEFYPRLREGAAVSTSQPSPGDLMDMWDRLLEEYEEVVYIPMSGGLSGSYETAAMLAREYDGHVHPVDNRRISVTLRQSVLEAKALADAGVSAGDIAARLEREGRDASIYIAVNTLELLKKSGRVTAAGAAIGTVLHIKPVLQIQGDKLDAYKKTRGMKAAMAAIIEGLCHDRETRFAGREVAIRAAYTGAETVGEAWRQELQSAFPDLEIGKDPLPISIACHTGEDALGVGIMPVSG